jgi:hypothetical protein
MHSFIRRENLKRYRNLLTTTSDEAVRSQLFKLIADEERQQILQLISEKESETARPPMPGTSMNGKSGAT